MKLTCIIDPSGEQHDDSQLLPEAPPRGSAGAASAASSPTAAEFPGILLLDAAATPAGPHGRAAAEQGRTVPASAESGSSTETAAATAAVDSGTSFGSRIFLPQATSLFWKSSSTKQ